MWWATQTVTTVGYGDIVPTQTAGQVIAAVLMIGGLSLFAVVTGMITSIFVTRGPLAQGAADDDPVVARLDALTREVGALRAQLEGGSSGEDAGPAEAG
jgi:voltage-gated potassium channel